MRCRYALLTSGIFIFASFLFHITKSDFFTAVVELEKLLDTQEHAATILNTYLQSEENRLNRLRKLTQKYANLLNAASEEGDSFLTNPINAYLLLKHLTADWKSALRLVHDTESNDVLSSISLQNVQFPSEEDLSGAAEALIRLQHIYSLDTSAIAEGRIEGAQLSSELAATDCYELGKQAYHAKFANYTIKWMQETMRRMKGGEIQAVDKVVVLEYIAYSAYDVGEFQLGLDATNKIIEIAPDHKRLYANYQYYQIKLNQFKDAPSSSPGLGTGDVQDGRFINITGRLWPERELLDQYKRLCRGESMKTPMEKSKLYCYITTNNKPYFLVQPIKVEIINFDPQIVLFHDIVTNAEIKSIQQVARPKLQRAVVQDTITGKIEASTDRISKSTLVNQYEHEVFIKINKRMEDITGLSAESSEDLHVINYGIGGHYDPHFDFAQAAQNVEQFRRLGNRIATWIFYLSDVPAGGATVFPISGVEMKPVKGAAGFWYNLKKNGEGDKNTLHAACPVLAGSKWVANKWFHEAGNEFRRPCSLNLYE